MESAKWAAASNDYSRMQGFGARSRGCLLRWSFAALLTRFDGGFPGDSEQPNDHIWSIARLFARAPGRRLLLQ